MVKHIEYNIHSIVGVSVTGPTTLIDEVDVHLRKFRGTAADCESLIEIAPFGQRPTTHYETAIDDLQYGEWSFERESIGVAWQWTAGRQRYFAESLPLPINLMIQLAMLQRSHTFCHAAGLDFNGAGLLMPAYPGTGKTTTATSLVQAGAKFLGDDLCIVGDGSIRSFPQALSVYPHHLEILGYEDAHIERGFRRGERADRVRDRLSGRRDVVSRATAKALGLVGTRCANVMPADVFGSDAIGDAVVLTDVVSLEREVGSDSLHVKQSSPSKMARLASVVLWHEWHASMHELMLLDAVNRGGGWIGELLASTEEILLREFSAARCTRVQIPADWNNQTLRREFPPMIDQLVGT